MGGAGGPSGAGVSVVWAQGPIVLTARGTLKLAMELTPGEIVLVDELVPIRWGPRRYLVSADELSAFVEAVRQGDEPRSTTAGEFLLRRGDWNLRVTGEPVIPVNVPTMPILELKP